MARTVVEEDGVPEVVEIMAVVVVAKKPSQQNLHSLHMWETFLGTQFKGISIIYFKIYG